MRIELPKFIQAHSVHNFLKSASFFPEGASELALVFNSFNGIEPYGIAMLAAWADHCKRKGITIRCENSQAGGTAYLRRMGLFEYLPSDGACARFTHHEEAGRFVALRKISNQAELNAFCVDVAPMLHQPGNIQIVTYCLAELTRNVLEHSGASAFVCAQLYSNRNKISIGIADCGSGIMKALERNYAPASHEDAIVTALKPGVTGTAATTYGSSDNAGLGLFYTRAMARASNQYFVIASGTAAYRLALGQRNTPLTRDPTADRHKLYKGLPYWQGTVVGIDLGTETLDTLADLIRMIGEVAAAPTTGAPRVRPKVKFT